MIVSDAQVDANRRNAARSTGPRTIEGKEKSRANAIKHGLCSSTLVSENLELIQQRSLELFCALKPQNLYQNWLVDQMAVISLRVDRSERIERRAHDRKALQAELCWEDDRRLQAIQLGSRLAENPAEVVEQLRRTPQGCEWLMTRWALLAYTAESVAPWNADQTRLAFDLLGTPGEFRQGQEPGASIDCDGKTLGPARERQVAVARSQIAELKARREVADDLDEVAQALAMASLDIQEENDPDLKRLRRYEATLHHRFRWFMAQLQMKHDNKMIPALMNTWKGETQTTEADPTQQPAPESTEPEVNHLVDPQPDPEPTPDDETKTRTDVDGPILLDARVEKKLRKAEARRESRQRKTERLRA